MRENRTPYYDINCFEKSEICPDECYQVIKLLLISNQDERPHFCNQTSPWKESVNPKQKDVLQILDEFSSFHPSDLHLYSIIFKQILYSFYLCLKRIKLHLPKPISLLILSFLSINKK